jgi:hypothetical protein
MQQNHWQCRKQVPLHPQLLWETRLLDKPLT